MTDVKYSLLIDMVEHIASLVAEGRQAEAAPVVDRAVAAEREKVAQWMLANSFATGHGDTLEDLLAELKWQVAEMRDRITAVRAEEREACAELVEPTADQRAWPNDYLGGQEGVKLLDNLAATIRGRK